MTFWQLILILSCWNLLVINTENLGIQNSIEENSSTSPCQFPNDERQGKFYTFEPFSGGNCTPHTNAYGSYSAVCTGGLDVELLLRENHDIRYLTIRKWPLRCFPPSIVFDIFPALRNLTIEDSNFTHFSEDFPSNALHLKHLRLNGLPNATLPNSLLRHLSALHDLDLTGNNLETIDHQFINSAVNLKYVYLSNNKWNCSHKGLRWFSDLNSSRREAAHQKVVDYKNLTCQGNMFKGKPLHVVMDLLKSLRVECPPMCSCYLTNLVRPPGWDSLVPVSTTDCRWKKLKDFPASVPAITTVLLLHGNMISSVRSLAQNPAFRRVADVYLDNNLVTSVQPLEGADWMLYFRVLSLRGNNLTHLPTHAFDNAFQHNQNIGQVFLGNNPWRCDCHFTPAFQELLLKHQKVVEDLPDITCAESENEEISNAQIQTLSRSAICRQSSELLHPLDILNVILSLLIIFVLGKFAYDYYCFKKTGKLPWIVSKIP